VAFCPKCRYEYEVGILVCPDCNETLVDELPPEKIAAVMPDDSWIVVGNVASGIKSEIARGSLDSNNIPSVILSSTFGAFGKGMDFHSGLAGAHGGGNIIMVPRDYREEAVLILEAVLGEDLIQPEGQ
jgi:hypothetical protein